MRKNGWTAEGHRAYVETQLSRREFVRRGGVLIAGGALGLGACRGTGESPMTAGREGCIDIQVVPRAVLGRTGVEVSVLGLGTGSLGHQNKNNPDQAKLNRVYGEAIDRGITYVDTGPTYGGAQKALNSVLRTRRDKVFLVTKIPAETGDEAQASLEESLREMAVDHVDLLHLHNLGAKDVDRVLGKGGAWEYLLKAKEEGKTRFVGVTGHMRPGRFPRVLETGTVDVIMVVMNFVDRHTYGFEEKVLPVARRHGSGVMAMKVYGGLRGGFKSYGAAEDQPSKLEDGHDRAVAYVRSLEGVTGMVIGVFSTEEVVRNIHMVATARPLSGEDFDRLCAEGKALAPAWGTRLGPPV